VKIMTSEGNTTKITDGGRIVIPLEYRRALNLKTGDDVIITLEEGGIHLMSRDEALRRAQKIVQDYSGNRSLAGELITERRQEAENE
jgi:AbrB family looped-hinge helix DNA binding protein